MAKRAAHFLGKKPATSRDYAFKYDKRGENPIQKLGAGEPWFFIRGQDQLSPEAISAYADLLKRESDKAFASDKRQLADSLLKQALGVQMVARAFVDWQLDHRDKVKLPD